MDMALALSAWVATLLSALGLYAGSRNCRWSRRPRRPHLCTRLGFVFAVLALVLWIGLLGGGAGLCAMLGTWMLALMALPYLALGAAPDASERA